MPIFVSYSLFLCAGWISACLLPLNIKVPPLLSPSLITFPLFWFYILGFFHSSGILGCLTIEGLKKKNSVCFNACVSSKPLLLFLNAGLRILKSACVGHWHLWCGKLLDAHNSAAVAFLQLFILCWQLSGLSCVCFVQNAFLKLFPTVALLRWEAVPHVPSNTAQMGRAVNGAPHTEDGRERLQHLQRVREIPLGNAWVLC